MNHFLMGFIIFWATFLIFLPIGFVFYRFYYFFRNPKREIPDGNNIVSPADGYILYIKDIKNNEVPLSIKKNNKIYLNELVKNARCDYNLVIGIFMTPFSVHHNRLPFDGKITNNYYFNNNNKSMLRGFLNLFFNLKPFELGGEYILENERNTIEIESDNIKAAVVQIADKWVNKIQNDEKIKIGYYGQKGDLFGMIRMGSQCDLFLKIDTNYKLVVKEKDYVKAGQSILIEM